jgi:hypothetical protein
MNTGKYGYRYNVQGREEKALIRADGTNSKDDRKQRNER